MCPWRVGIVLIGSHSFLSAAKSFRVQREKGSLSLCSDRGLAFQLIARSTVASSWQRADLASQQHCNRRHGPVCVFICGACQWRTAALDERTYGSGAHRGRAAAQPPPAACSTAAGPLPPAAPPPPGCSPAGARAWLAIVRILFTQCAFPPQVLLDKSTPHTLYRWLALTAVLILYAIRVYLLKG